MSLFERFLVVAVFVALVMFVVLRVVPQVPSGTAFLLGAVTMIAADFVRKVARVSELPFLGRRHDPD